MKGHSKTQSGHSQRSLGNAIIRAIASTGMMASALFTLGVAVATTSAGAASTTTLSGSPYNGSDGVLDLSPTITHQSDPYSTTSDNIFGANPAAKEQQTCPTITTGKADPKSDLTDFWIGEAGSTIPNTLPGTSSFLYLAWQRVATSGDANIDFELNQSTGAACVGPTVNNLRTGGDLLIQYNFASTTGAATVDVYRWVTSGTCDIGSIATYGGCWRYEPLAPTAYEASVSSPNRNFGETVINLQASGIFPTGVCENLASAFVKTRSSTSPTADLKDYVAPIPVTVENCSPSKIVTTPSDLTPTLGEAVTDSVTVTGNSTQHAPQGTVTFYVCANATTGCDPTSAGATKLLGANPAPLNSSGADTSTATSPSYTPPAPGDYCFAGVYTPTAGTAIYTGSTDGSKTECFVVGPAASTSKTTVSGGPLTLGSGGVLSDSVTVTGNATGGHPTGTVDFYVCQTSTTSTTLTPGTCDPTKLTAQTSNAALSPSIGATSSASSASFSPTSAGTWCFAAVYSGDTNYQASQDNTTASNADTLECALVGKAASSVSTVVYDNATKAAWTNTEATNSQAYDTSKVTGVANVVPTGTVTYRLYTDGSCTTTPSTSQTVTLSGGAVPDSAATGPLAPGNYGYKAVYSGDTNYAGSTGVCEPFSVGEAPSTTSTTVYDNAGTTKAAWDNHETVGAEAFDTVTVTSTNGTPSGTVTFYYFTDGNCAAPISSETVTLSGTGKAASSPTAPLAAGDYSYQAVYSGGGGFAGSTGACEPFSVAKVDSSTATTVYDASTTQPWAKTETTGASAYDTSTVTGVSGFVPSGPLAYTFFPNGSCAAAAGSSTETVNLASNGSVPDSTTTAPLAAGSYSFEAVYAGDSNYNRSVGSCEPFSVDVAPSSLSTIVNDSSTKAAWTGTETLGAAAYDTSSVGGAVTHFTPTGTVTYTLFPNKSCTAPSTALNSTEATSTVTLAAGSVPDSDATAALAAGDYSFLAKYSGDGNYAPATASCEPFSVAPAATAVSTVVDDAATSQPWTGGETTGASAYDTASFASVTGFTPTGTVTYRFFGNGSCTNPAQRPDPFSTVTLSAGAIPNSGPTGALSTGSYSFQATYAGDTNYQGSTGTCEPFTVAAVAASPTPASVTAQKTSNPADGSVVTVGSTVVYTITLTNSGQVAATNVTVTDTVPAGTSFVSADQGGNQANGTVTWSGLNVPAGGTTAVSFTVTVNSNDPDGEAIPNVAQFTNVNTPGCNGDPCSTNTVTVTVHTAQLAPASSPTTSTTSTTSTTVAPTTTTTAAPVAPATVTPPATTGSKTVLAFTGADMLRTLGAGIFLATTGGVLTVISRRRRRSN